MHHTIKGIEKVSEKILATTIRMMEDLKDEEGEIVEEIVDLLDDSIDNEIVIQNVMTVLGAHVEDAKLVHIGIGEFAEAVIKGEEAIEKIHSSFFQQVWYGDMYDESGVEGLKALHQDLLTQEKQLTNDFIISSVISRLSGSVMYDNSESD